MEIAVFEEREEGEIVEDDLEDVSDCSMSPGSPLYSGKSVSPPELLSAVCLSSVSSSEYQMTRKLCLRKKHKRKRKPDEHVPKRKHCRHRRKSTVVESDADSTNDAFDPTFAKQLRVAVDREPSQDLLHNSLKTRLKAFIDTDEQSEEDVNSLDKATVKDDVESEDRANDAIEVQIVETKISDNKENECKPEKVEKAKFDGIDDSELQELRFEALKSFMIENHKRRRRRMAQNHVENINSDSENKEEVCDTDKENDKSVMNNDANAKLVVISGETDVEVVTKQMADMPMVDGCECVDSLEEDADILRAMLLASMSKQLSAKSVEDTTKIPGFPIRKLEKSNHNSLNVTITKPLLRTIKTDFYNITHTNKLSKQPHVVVKPLIINVNADSDSDTDNLTSSITETNNALKATVTEFLKKQRAEVEASVKKKPPNGSDSSFNRSDDPLMEKSVMKLLPRSQQLEYRRLKQHLINARKKMRTRRLSQKLSESANSKKVPKLKTDSIENVGGGGGKRSTEHPGNFQKTLHDIQVRKNGRLQMIGKYQSLAPLLNRINQASNERRLHEIEIKKLLQQIQKTRTKLAASHQNFTGLVQELLCEKDVIDRGVHNAQTSLYTSTPNKLVNKVQSCNISTVAESLEKIVDAKQVKSTDIKELLDPNDISKVFVEQPSVEPVAILKYTSPLNSSRNGVKDPLTTFCPYDLLGVCKDKECRYVHCS